MGGRAHEKAEPEDLFWPCKISLASLIFVATKGEPPRSGWLSIMILRCASLICCLELVSLQVAGAYTHLNKDCSSHMSLCQRTSPDAENLSRLATRHGGLKARGATAEN